MLPTGGGEESGGAGDNSAIAFSLTCDDLFSRSEIFVNIGDDALEVDLMRFDDLVDDGRGTGQQDSMIFWFWAKIFCSSTVWLSTASTSLSVFAICIAMISSSCAILRLCWTIISCSLSICPVPSGEGSGALTLGADEPTMSAKDLPGWMAVREEA